MASTKGRDLTWSQDHPLCPIVFCSSAPHSRRIQNKKPQLQRLDRWPPQASPQPDAAQALSSVHEPLESPAQHPWLRAVLELQDVLHLLVFSAKHLAERAPDLNSEVMRLYPLRSHKNSVKPPAFSHLHKQGGESPARLPQKLRADGELKHGAKGGTITKFLSGMLTAVIRNQFKKKSVYLHPDTDMRITFISFMH